jgi:uncharacterized cupin superfamily protein
VTTFDLTTEDLEAGDGPPERFGVREADVGPAIGAAHLGGSVFEIAPGKAAVPYHWEAAQEEWLLVLAGTPTVRHPEGEDVLAPGDLVVFEVGPAGAHQVRNDAGEPCRVLMVSNRVDVNAVVYPDSGKVGVRTPWLRSNHRSADAVDYWDGE